MVTTCTIENDPVKAHYKSFVSQKDMLRIMFRIKFFATLCTIIFTIIPIFVIMYDTKQSIDYLYVFVIILSIVSSIAMIMYYGYRKYSNDFVHLYFAIPNVYSFIIVFIYTSSIVVYTIEALNLNVISYLCILIFIYLIFTLFFLNYARKFTFKNFDKLYFTIGEKIFFDHHKFKESLKLPQYHLNICYFFLAVVAIAAISFRGLHYPFGYAISMGMVVALATFFSYPYLVISAYVLWFIRPRVEKHFNQPLLSDYGGFFELDPLIAENFFGPNPVKRPIKAEEIWGRN